MNAASARRYVRELQTFAAFPSVSAQPGRYSGALHACAAWLARHLRDVTGLHRVRLNRCGPYPVVTAEWLGAGPRAPTVLVYGHYDVQPPEPLAAWRTPPFEPAVRGDYLCGRGVSDDKGQLFVHLKAMEQLLQRDGRLPVNVRCLFEGAEEIGSPGLGDFLRNNREALRSDVALVSDMAMPAPDQPALTYGMRGVLYLELQVRHSLPDLHSGNFGGAVQTPLQALCGLIGQLFHPDGRIAIPGFYDDVAPHSMAEQRHMVPSGRPSSLPAGGEAQFSLYARTALRPALTVCGVAGGYSGPGLKAVAPAAARAKLDFRLAEGQDPDRIFDLVQDWVRRKLPPAQQYSLSRLMSVPAVVLPRQHPAWRAAEEALTQAFGRSPLWLRSGGTVPIVQLLQTGLGVPAVLMGFGLPDDRIHAPNERFYLPNFFRGIRASRLFLEKLAG